MVKKEEEREKRVWPWTVTLIQFLVPSSPAHQPGIHIHSEQCSRYLEPSLEAIKGEHAMLPATGALARLLCPPTLSVYWVPIVPPSRSGPSDTNSAHLGGNALLKGQSSLTCLLACLFSEGHGLCHPCLCILSQHLIKCLAQSSRCLRNVCSIS